MEKIVRDRRYFETYVTDDEFIEILKKSERKKISVACFENNFSEGKLYERLCEEDFINKVLVYGVSRKDKLNEKLIFVKKLKKAMFKDIDNMVFYIKTDVDIDIVKPLVEIKGLCDALEINFGVETEKGIFLGNCFEESELLIKTLNALSVESLKERYEIVYDYLCDELDEKFANNALCKFSGDRCVLNRKSYNHDKIMGCCYSFKYNGLYFSEIKRCEKLGEKGCTAKCLGCKLFTCDYLRKQGLRFRLRHMALAEAFFTRKQQDILRTTFFVEKDEVIKKILHC